MLRYYKSSLEKPVSEFQFGDPPRNGKQVNVTGGHSAPTPYHVEIWVDGKLKDTKVSHSKDEAESFQKEEIAR